MRWVCCLLLIREAFRKAVRQAFRKAFRNAFEATPFVMQQPPGAANEALAAAAPHLSRPRGGLWLSCRALAGLPPAT